MSSVGKEISDYKMNAYAKFHIPTQDEVMDDIIAIGKALVSERIKPNGKGDIFAVFVGYGHGKFGFNGFIGDHIGLLDSDGNLLHIGDIVELTLKNGKTVSQFVFNMIPKEYAIGLCNVRLVKSYKEIPIKCNYNKGASINIVSCALEYLKYNNRPQKENEMGMVL